MKGKSAMPQQILPLIPRGATQINGLVSVWRSDENWTYFYSTHPIYSHRKRDRRMFRIFTFQLIDPGLLGTLRKDIVSRSLEEVSDKPTKQQLDENPYTVLPGRRLIEPLHNCLSI
jgi:hypothetical protein